MPPKREQALLSRDQYTRLLWSVARAAREPDLAVALLLSPGEAPSGFLDQGDLLELLDVPTHSEAGARLSHRHREVLLEVAVEAVTKLSVAQATR